jgi:hypothetical protein
MNIFDSDVYDSPIDTESDYESESDFELSNDDVESLSDDKENSNGSGDLQITAHYPAQTITTHPQYDYFDDHDPTVNVFIIQRSIKGGERLSNQDFRVQLCEEMIEN